MRGGIWVVEVVEEPLCGRNGGTIYRGAPRRGRGSTGRRISALDGRVFKSEGRKHLFEAVEEIVLKRYTV